MSNWNNRVETKLDAIVKDLGEIKITQAEQHLTLSEHTKRSTMLESIVIPIQRKVTLVEGALKFIGILALLVGIAEGIAAWIKH